MVAKCLKIKNLMTNQKNKLKLINFGFDFISGGSQPTSESNINQHSYYYTAPEQIEGSEQTPQTDVWNCGVILYYFTHGRYPYVGEDITEIKEKIKTTR
jgi:serine/threonine protein kinase